MVTFVHVLAASVWVGGQIVLGALVARVRRSQPEALGEMARAFGPLAWGAFVVLVATGMMRLAMLDPASQPGGWTATLGAKVLLVLIAGGATAVHATGRTRAALAWGAAVGLVASLAAMFLGVLLASV